MSVLSAWSVAWSVPVLSLAVLSTLAVDLGAQSFPSVPLWKKEISAKPVPVAAPVAGGDRLFLALESGISARRMSDGEEVWTKPIVADGPMAASDGFLVVQSGGAIHILAAASGTEVWTDTPGKMTAPPLVHGEWLFVAADEKLLAYAAADGTKRWSHDLGVIEQRPAFQGDHMYVPVADGQLVALIVESGKELWRQDIGIKPTEPLVYGDHIYIGSGAKYFYSLKMLNGEVEWTFSVGAGVVGRAAADATHVYFVALDNLLRAHERRRGEFRWKKDLAYRPSAGPTLTGKSVSAPGMSSTLQSFDLIDPKPTGQLSLGDKLATVPVFIETANGFTVAALTGGLNNVWVLTLAGPPAATAPAIAVQPLTILPGVQIRLAPPTIPRG